MVQDAPPADSKALNRKLSGLAGFWFTESICHAIITHLAHNQHPRKKHSGTEPNSEIGTKAESYVHRNRCGVGDRKGDSAQLTGRNADYCSLTGVIRWQCRGQHCDRWGLSDDHRPDAR